MRVNNEKFEVKQCTCGCKLYFLLEKIGPDNYREVAAQLEEDDAKFLCCHLLQLSFGELRSANAIRCDQAFHPLDDWSPSDWVTAIAGEVGEAANMIKKRRRGETIDTAEIAKELADAVLYLDLLAARLRIDLGEAVRSKFNEVSDRVSSPIRL